MGCWFVELRLDYDDLIFTVYLTSSYFGTPEETSSALSLGLTIAGFLIAILAPVTGQRNDKSGRGIFWLGVNTLLLVARWRRASSWLPPRSTCGWVSR